MDGYKSVAEEEIKEELEDNQIQVIKVTRMISNIRTEKADCLAEDDKIFLYKSRSQ